MDTTLPAVAEELLKEIKKAFQETSHVPDDLLLGLKFIFGPSAVPALDLVDQRSVTRVMSPSGRTAYQVCGGPGFTSELSVTRESWSSSTILSASTGGGSSLKGLAAHCDASFGRPGEGALCSVPLPFS
ncbi:zinc finger SWIM domain-containing protein 7 isoform X1 [Egretta garzetta]|uniref:zinc finger SWIM domain-containing protein 7 isoform X1 n=1 Tax=Egretta garzetta TaxID=188379 RepID=UPI00163D0938|nr:zinc finger SWIM domain-containing protein 7 isoform X1 [Egretta garzetta]